MDINANILTKEKVADALHSSSNSLDYKTRLYSFFTHIPQFLIEMAVILQEKIKKSISFKENVTSVNQDSHGHVLQKSSSFLTERQYLHLEPSNILTPLHQAILLGLDEDDTFSPLSKDLMKRISLLGRSSIPEELLKLFFEDLYPCRSLTDFRDALEQLIEHRVIKYLSPSLSNLICYEIDYQLQEALYKKFADEQQKEICAQVWERTKFQLEELIKDQGRHEKGFHLYLDHAVSFLRKEPFKLLLKGPQRDDILLLLDQLFEEEGFYEIAIPLLIQQDHSHALTSESPYAHVQKVLTDIRNTCSSLGEHSKVIKCYEKELEIAKALKDHELEMKGYGNLGNAYTSWGKYDQATDYYNQQLALALELKNQLGVTRAYANLGNTEYNLVKYHQAIMYHEKDLKISLGIRDQVGEGRAYNNLGNAYKALQECNKAIQYYEKSLKIAREFEDREGEGRCYFNIGSCYNFLGKYDQAIDYTKKSLAIDLELGNRLGELRAYNHLGSTYRYLGRYHQAIEYHKKELMIALELKNQKCEGIAYNALGIAYHELGESLQAIEHHKKDLIITQELKDRKGEGNAYGSLGNAYNGLGKYHQAIEYYKKQLTIVKEQEDQAGEGRVSCNLGNAYASLGNSVKAIKYYKNDLAIALKIGSLMAEGRAYGNLGRYYYMIADYVKAIYYHKKQLEINLLIKSTVGKENAYGNLGNTYYALRNYPEAEVYFRKSIEIAAILQQNAKEAQWQVTIFEQLSTAYMGLEKVLLLQGKNKEALETSDMRHSRVLSSLLSQKLSLEKNQDPIIQALPFQNMQEMAKKLHTTFIVYSVIPLGDEKTHIHAYIVSSKQNSIQSIPITIPDGAFSQLDQIFKTFPYQDEDKRPVRGKKNPNELFKEKLINWYDILIHPLEPYLPSQDSEETLTFIPDGFLAHLPFGAFYHAKEDKYLIEKYPVSIAPSIQVLSLLDQLPKEFSDQALLVGNPLTPKKEEDNLIYAESEIRQTLVPLMETFSQQIFTQEMATVDNIFNHAPGSRWIHIACHGLSNQKPPGDPHSVFEGFFKLAPDEQHPSGEFHAKEVNSLVLRADLVFMSACHLGRGNLQKEGSIGPIWSFLGAGALSTIASYWPLPEGKITVQMVDTFYRHYLGIGTVKLNKAKALQQAVLMAMKIERNKPRQWGAFFLSGLIE
ncbi:MAG: tetratricopeptide repeat protein [Candidatus Rhabdochlamydia sp.]